MRVNRSTAVNRCIEVHYLCLACQQIGFYFGHTGHKRRRGQHAVLLHGFFQSDIVIHHRSGGYIKETYSLVADSITHLASVKDNLIRAAFQQACAKLANLAAQTLCADFYGLTCNICCTGCVGTRVIRRRVGIRTEYGNVIVITFQNLCCHLCQNGIAACAHIGSTDQQSVMSLIVDFDGSTADVAVRNGAALHRNSHAHCAYLAVRQLLQRELLLPAAHLAYLLQAAVQRAACVGRTVISRHNIALTRNIHLTQLNRVHLQACCQLVHSGFYGKDALRSTVPAVCACSLQVGVNYVKAEAEGLGTVQRNRLVTGKADGRRTVLAVSTGIGKSI